MNLWSLKMIETVHDEHCIQIFIYKLAVPVHQWHPAMLRPIMQTDIMASPETWNIQPSVTLSRGWSEGHYL